MDNTDTSADSNAVAEVKLSTRDLEVYYGDKPALNKISLDIILDRPLWLRKINFYPVSK